MGFLTDQASRFVAATAPEHTTVQREMTEHAATEGFPIIGPAAGAVLRLLARLTDADRVFEFGSGFGYSASWFLRGGAEHVVCTEFDADEAELGREFMADAGWDDRVVFEVGDAMDAVERYEGPFDVVLVDHQKHRYADAFAAVKPKLAAGGVVVADNIMAGPIDLDDLLAHVEDGQSLPADDQETAGIARYVDTVREDADFETTILPVGSGIAVSTSLGN